jgi:hypothetical protein
MQLAVRACIAFTLAIPVGYAMMQAARHARADQLAQSDTIPALEAARLIEPSNAAYPIRIATLDPTRHADLETALRLNPHNPSSWLMQAAAREEAGDAPGAEQSLLKADSVARYYNPRWMTAFFYYRHGNLPEFTRWAHAALATGFGETDSLYRMAQKLGLSSDLIFRDIVPSGDPNPLGAWIALLIRDRKPEETIDAAFKLIATGPSTQRDLISWDTDTLYAAGHTDQSIALWNRMVQAHWFPAWPLDPASGKSLARTGFRGERTERGFDWRYPAPQGVNVSVAEYDGSLRLEFNGNEPPDCELAEQLAPLLPNRTYRLAVKYRSTNIPPRAGLQWHILKTDLPLATRNGDSAEESVTFTAPAAQTNAKLVFDYHRSPGTTRLEGTLWIESVQLTLLP